MTPWLEIIIPARGPGDVLAATIASLVAQTERGFGVVLADDTFEKQLAAAGIPTRSIQPPYAVSQIEQWNWVHGQAVAEWLKPLLPGQKLDPTFVARLKERVTGQPKAQFVRCDARIGTEWGPQALRAPIEQSTFSPADFLHYFPARMDWVGYLVNVAYSRVAWLAMGGFSVQLPGCAALNLNLMLALHYGVENLPECLVSAESPGLVSLNANGQRRVNPWLERWLVLRQARNYCLSAKLPWPKCGVARGVWSGQTLLEEPL